MKAYVISPRKAVVEAAQSASIEIVQIGTKNQLLNCPDTARSLILSNPLDAVEVARSLVDDGVEYADDHCVCIGFGDDSSQVAALVNSALALSKGRWGSFVSLEKMRDKQCFRNILGPCSKYSGKHWLAQDADTIKQAFEECPNGIVIKPISGSGSRGVACVVDPNEINTLQTDYPVLVEERFCGKEYSVETISWNGIHTPLIVTEKTTGGSSGVVEIGQSQPANLTNVETTHLYDAAIEILTLVGYKYGFSHIEFILENGVPKVVEAHGRVGGDRIADLMQWSLGTNGFELLFEAYRQDAFATVSPSGNHAEILFPDLTQWSGSDQEWLDTVLNMDDVVEATILCPNEKRHEVTSSSDRHALVIIAGPTAQHTALTINNLGT